MHAVGDVANGILAMRDLRPDIAFHLRGDLTVNAADAVVEARGAQGQCGLVETVLVAGAGAELEEFLGADAEFWNVIHEIGTDQIVIEDIMSGSNRCMRGEHCAGGDQFQRAGKIHVAFAYPLAAALQHLERGVTFVDMPYRRLQTEGAHGAHAADTEYDFLLDAGGDVATVELIGDGAVGVLVFRQVAVEQVQA